MGKIQVHRWSTQPGKRTLLFVPGFMTDSTDVNAIYDGGWRAPCVALANQHRASACVLAWPSGTARELLMSPGLRRLAKLMSVSPTDPTHWQPALNDTLLALDGLAAPGVTESAVDESFQRPLGNVSEWDRWLLEWQSEVSPASLPTMPTRALHATSAPAEPFSLAGLVGNAVQAWRRASAAANKTASEASLWFPADQEVVLVGHSLGTRVILGALAHHPSVASAVHHVALLAAAVARDAPLIDNIKGQQPKPLCFFSDEDWVLWALFRIGELDTTQALGLSGPLSGANLEGHDVAKSTPGWIHHHAYDDHLVKLLNGTLDNVWGA